LQKFSEPSHNVGVASKFTNVTVCEFFARNDAPPFAWRIAEFLQIQLRLFSNARLL